MICLPELPDEVIEMFKNKEAIAVHQVRKPPPVVSFLTFLMKFPMMSMYQDRLGTSTRRKVVIKEGVS